MQILISAADFKGYGVFLEKNRLYVSGALSHLKEAGIIFYHKSNPASFKRVVIPDEFFIGDVVCAYLTGAEFSELAYLFFADEKTFTDPYARELTADCKNCLIGRYSFYGPFKNDAALHITYDNSVFYTVNVRGYTMADRHIKFCNGTFKAMEKKTEYIKKLGVTGVIFMPCYEVIYNDSRDSLKTDFKKRPGEVKPNLWGFGRGYHFAVKKSLCVSDNPIAELQSMVKSFHDKGLECIFMMQYLEDTPEDYIVESLKYWLVNFHADGFRLVGPNVHTDRILGNPLFSATKIITDNFKYDDYKPLSIFKYKNLGVINHSFVAGARRFVKGDEDQVSYMSFAVRENGKYYAPIRNITDFAGFTLWDMVSYNVKHNDANGEDNTDGTDYNYSWNCGVEGETGKRNIKKLRLKLARNAMILTLLSQGAPMLLAGDEFLNTQKGNNNPYCQDNETGWVVDRNDKASRDFGNFLTALIAFRKRHSVLHQPKELMLFDYMSCKAPDVSFHGREAFKIDQSPVSREFAVLYFGDYSKQYTGIKEDSVYIIYNMHWEEKEFVLPLREKTKKWRLLYSTDGSTDETFDETHATDITGDAYIAKPRTVSVLLLTS